MSFVFSLLQSHGCNRPYPKFYGSASLCLPPPPSRGPGEKPKERKSYLKWRSLGLRIFSFTSIIVSSHTVPIHPFFQFQY
ncbi:hypothetical protein BDV27DRAFT_127830 [Aspergillus caelatus]|uniref:Uncharacterized protein n=1 Tax=Aspergillus caelatus TaxID=61420 RepID=A0A5N7A6G9_9EURO|nr:uncharacterized protein BDV27DRAFT_127830 [Aspergillus caelatus]KAE8364796.1 hypothetical protein BDV27DRAFT_127830 [Aspergillus caelatus]